MRPTYPDDTRSIHGAWALPGGSRHGTRVWTIEIASGPGKQRERFRRIVTRLRTSHTKNRTVSKFESVRIVDRLVYLQFSHVSMDNGLDFLSCQDEVMVRRKSFLWHFRCWFFLYIYTVRFFLFCRLFVWWTEFSFYRDIRDLVFKMRIKMPAVRIAQGKSFSHLPHCRNLLLF